MTKFCAENIPAELRNIPQWVGWKYRGKRKIPMNPNSGHEAKSNAPATWGTFDAALAAVIEHGLEGVGFMFAQDGGYAGVDYDDCVIDGEILPQVVEVLRTLNSYSEFSPNGGVKSFVKATKPAHDHCEAAGALGCSKVEVYDHARFFTVTGRRIDAYSANVEQRQAEINALCARLWPQREATAAPAPTAAVTSTMDRVERCRRYLAKCPVAISGNNGSNKKLRAACECIRFGLSDAESLPLLREYSARCKPAWTEKEILHKLNDARRKVEAAGQIGSRLHESNGKPVEGKALWHNAVPAWIFNLDGVKLRPYPRAILQAIANRCDHKPIDAHGSLGCARIGYEKLADMTGMGLRTAIVHVKRLLAMRLLVKVETGGIDFKTGEITANVYAIPGKYGVTIKQGCAKPAYRHTPPTGLCGGQDLHTVNGEAVK